MSHLHSEESSYQITFGSNLKNFPLQINKTNKILKNPISINFNKWFISPTLTSLTSNKFKSNSYKSKNTKEKLFFKLSFKF